MIRVCPTKSIKPVDRENAKLQELKVSVRLTDGVYPPRVFKPSQCLHYPPNTTLVWTSTSILPLFVAVVIRFHAAVFVPTERTVF
jgi:hypothetical protein